MSVRKRSWTTPSGAEKTSWVVDYTDTKGKRRLKTFKLKKEADAFAAKASVEVREGMHVADSASATVAVAGQLWLTSARAAELERSTIAAYETHLRRHIVPRIGSTKLTALSIPVVRAFEDQLRADGVSRATAGKVLTSLGSLLADAQERGLVVRNVIRDIRGRRGAGERRKEKRHKGRLVVGVDIPTTDEIRALVGALKGRWRPVLLTAIFTGLRSSELRGLRWADIDLEKSEISVRQRADAYNVIGPPKSISGDRTVPIPPILVNTLREWKQNCPMRDSGQKKADGSPEMELYLAFPNGLGRIEQRNNIVYRGLHRAEIAAGIAIATGELTKRGKPIFEPKYHGLHALRHWYASWCINRKADGGLELPAKMVQERLGHSNISMTLDTYGHLFPRVDDAGELAAAEDALLGKRNIDATRTQIR